MEAGNTFDHQQALLNSLARPYDPYADVDHWENIQVRPPSGTGATLTAGNVYYFFPSKPLIARGIITSISVSTNTAQMALSAGTIYQANMYMTLVNVKGEKVIERMPVMDLVLGTVATVGVDTYTNGYTRTFWLENIDLGKSYIEPVRAYASSGQNPALPFPSFFYFRIGYKDK